LHFYEEKAMSLIFEIRLKNVRLVNQMLFTGKQADFARAIGKSPTYVNAMLTDADVKNHKNIGEKVAREIEQGCGLPNGWMDQDHGEGSDLSGIVAPSQTISARRVVEAEDGHPDYIMVPHREVRFAAGDGEMVFDEPSAPPLAFTRDWIRKNGLQVDKLVVAYATGDSMEPRIHDGDTMLIDTSRKTLTDGKIYALRVLDQLRVKRVQVRTNSVVLVSDNNKYSPEELSHDQVENLDVVGRVVWVSGCL
jgi:hypothetical protein